MIYRILVVFIVCLLVASVGSAEVIYLKNGKIVQGKIVDKTPYSVKVQVSGTVRTYYVNEIKRIEGLKEEFSGFETGEQSEPATEDPIEQGIVGDDPAAEESLGERKSPREVAKVKQELVTRLLEANGVRENMSLRYLQIISKYPPDVQEKLRDLFIVDELVQRVIPVYAKYYTEDELRALITFYKSPVGGKSLDITEQITEETVNIMIEYFLEKAKQQGLAGE